MLPSPTRRRRAIVALAGALLATVGLSTVAAAPAHAAKPPFPVGGLKPNPAAARTSLASAPQAAAAAAAAAATVPESYDLSAWAVPTGDQGAVGACTSWTVGYTISGWYARRQGNTGRPFAPMFLYSQITGGRNVGTTFPSNLNLESSAGIAPQAVYTQGNYNYTTQPTAAQKTEALNYRISSWTALYGGKTQAAASGKALIMDAISHDRPVALGMEVYNNFFAVRAASDHYDSVAGSAFAGNHAVAALAYDSYGVKIQNSWGSGWGNGGFAWLSWNFIARNTFEAYSVNGFTAPSAGPAPTVTDLSTAHGPWPGGEQVTVTGAGLTGAAVMFGNTAATGVTVAADGTSVTATVPRGTPGDVAVTVTTANGRSDALTYTYDAADPTITSLTPALGTAAGGTRVTIAGTNLYGSATVMFGSKAATGVTVAADGQSISVVTPSGTVGTAAVTVRNAGGTSAAATYNYRWPINPIVAAAATAVVRPGSVTVTGTVKQPPRNTPIARLAVTLLARAAGSSDAFAAVATATTGTTGVVSFVRPISAATEFRLAIAGDVVSNVVTVRVVPAPTATSLSAVSGPRRGGTTVVITGTNLRDTTVKVNGVAARVVSVSDDGTTLTFVTPASGRTGRFPVVVAGRTGSAGQSTFTYV